MKVKIYTLRTSNRLITDKKISRGKRRRDLAYRLEHRKAKGKNRKKSGIEK